jgi:hypothetical protein
MFYNVEQLTVANTLAFFVTELPLFKGFLLQALGVDASQCFSLFLTL